MSSATLLALNNLIAGSSLPSNLSYQFNELWIHHAEDSMYTFAEWEKDSLYSWAALCPYIYGSAVFQARSLLSLTEDSILPLSACESSFNATYNKGFNRGSEKEVPLRIYPNPAQSADVFFVDIAPEEIEEVYLYGLDGKRIALSLNGYAGQSEIQLPSLSEGMYLGSLRLKDGSLKAFKLSIVH